YGCPGVNGEAGTEQAAAVVTNFPGTAVTAANKTVVLSSTTGLAAGNLVTDNSGSIPVADPIVKVKGGGKIKLQFAPKSTVASDTLTVDTDPQNGENGFTTWGHENPFNDGLFEEPAYGSGNGIEELEGTGNASTVGHSNDTLDPLPTSSTAGDLVPVAPLDAARSSRAPNLV